MHTQPICQWIVSIHISIFNWYQLTLWPRLSGIYFDFSRGSCASLVDLWTAYSAALRLPRKQLLPGNGRPRSVTKQQSWVCASALVLHSEKRNSNQPMWMVTHKHVGQAHGTAEHHSSTCKHTHHAFITISSSASSVTSNKQICI